MKDVYPVMEMFVENLKPKAFMSLAHSFPGSSLYFSHFSKEIDQFFSDSKYVVGKETVAV